MESYDAWQLRNGDSPRRRRLLDQADRLILATPRFSIIVPVYNPPLDVFRAMIGSVLDQTMTNWELVLVDDASPNPCVRDEMRHWSSKDDRIVCEFRECNGHISLATNHAAAVARGEFLILLDHDDLLQPDALAHVAAFLEKHPAADLIYSDDDKLGEEGRRHSAQFKPGWSPELLLGYCYTGHLTAVRTDLYRSVGGMRQGFEGSQDHDFWLRASEQAQQVGHIPQLLYHWRVLPGSTAASGHCKPESFEAGRRAVEEAFQRRGISCQVKLSDWGAKSGCAIFEPVMPDDGPSVAILINGKHDRRSMKSLVDSLKKTTYTNYQIYLIHHDPTNSGDIDFIGGRSCRVLRISGQQRSLNTSAIQNAAAEQLDEDLLLFLDAECEVSDPRWLSQMVGWSRLAGVGLVGTRLLSAGNKLQHAGIVHGLHEGLPGYAFQSVAWWDPGYLNLARVSHNRLSVSRACMLTPRKLFLELGGFDEQNFPFSLNDADYGHRLNDVGYRGVICAESELILHSELHPPGDESPREIAAYRERHGRRIDPYVSPHWDNDSALFPIKPTVVPIVAVTEPIRVLGVTHNLNWEGAPRFESELMIRLKREGLIDPVVLSVEDGPLRNSLNAAGIDVFVDPSLATASLTGPHHESTVERLARLFRERRFELIHANTAENFWAIEAAQAAGIPSVWSIHESEPWQTYYDRFPREVASRALGAFALPYRVVFTARSTAQSWSALDVTGNFELIRYALDRARFRNELERTNRAQAREFLELEPDTLCVLIVGTVCERKGQHDLVRAFSLLPGEIASRMTCVVVGARDDQSYCRMLHVLVEALPIDRRHRFRIFPVTGQTAAYWLAADLFCCTSRVESYPHVIQEAMAATLPIVTTPVFGISEQVRESVNALIYDPGDIATLTQHLIVFAQNAQKRREFAEASSWTLDSLPNPSDMDRRYGCVFRAAAESIPIGIPP